MTDDTADACLRDLLAELSRDEPDRSAVLALLSNLHGWIAADGSLPGVTSVVPAGTFEVGS